MRLTVSTIYLAFWMLHLASEKGHADERQLGYREQSPYYNPNILRHRQLNERRNTVHPHIYDFEGTTWRLESELRRVRLKLIESACRMPGRKCRYIFECCSLNCTQQPRRCV